MRQTVFYIFLGVALLAPLPLGANRPWAWALLSVLVGVLLILEAAASLSSQENPKFSVRIRGPLIIWLLVGLWGFLQATGTFFPDTTVHPLWFDAAAINGVAANAVISLNPDASLTALMLFLSYGGIFWLSARFCSTHTNAEIVLKAIVFAQVIYAVYGLALFFTGSKTILWLDKWAYLNDVTSTFVNRNTYATFAGLGVLCTTAYLFVLVQKDFKGLLTRREMFRAFSEAVFSKGWLPLLGVLVTATALLLTHSRGGFLSTAVALLVLIGGLSYSRMIPKQISKWVFASVSVATVFVLMMSGDVVIQRLENTSFDNSIRDEVYVQTIMAIEVEPLVGYGYGTFEQAFLPFKTDQIANRRWDKAHNTYLELSMELGVPATIALVVVFVMLLAVFINGLRHRSRRRVYAVIGIASIVLVAAHALVDFSLQIPGFTACFALILGMAWGQSWPSEGKRVSRTRS